MRYPPALLKPPTGFIVALLMIAAMIDPSSLRAGGDRADQREVIRELPAKPEIVIELISADCVVEEGRGDLIRLRVVLSYAEDRYQVEVSEGSTNFRLRERFPRGPARGSATWYLSVPAATDLLFSSASGDFQSRGDFGKLEADSATGGISIRDLDGRIDVNTASGAVRLREVSGELSVTTASGDVEVAGFEGRLDLRTASGDAELDDLAAEIEATTAAGNVGVSGLHLTGECSFSSAAGDVRVGLAAAPAFDLSLSSTSGLVELDLNGHNAVGTFVFTALRDAGRIESPIDFDEKEIFVHAGQTYVRRTLSRFSALPRIDLATEVGTARLKP